MRDPVATLCLMAMLASSCTAAVAASPPPSPTTSSLPVAASSPPPLPRPEATVAVAFLGTVAPIDSVTRASMGGSWHRGCPVPIADLRLLTVTFWGFDARPHTGQLIAHRRYAADLVRVFRELYDDRFPLRKLEILHSYAGDHYDGRTARPSDDDTAAFNCRNAVGSNAWSEHAYGRAIDINPIENPYVGSTGRVVPKEGRPFTDRSRSAKGMITRNDVVVRAFASVGWAWGGAWHTLKDYMHFSATGR